MARTRKQNSDQLSLLEARVNTAPLVPGIREKVNLRRDGGCKGISETTRILLNHWFLTDHRLPNGRKFAYHPFQREAVETFRICGFARLLPRRAVRKKPLLSGAERRGSQSSRRMQRRCVARRRQRDRCSRLP